jgi:hypothetical protein
MYPLYCTLYLCALTRRHLQALVALSFAFVVTFFASISRCALHWLRLRKLFWFTNNKALIKSRKKEIRKCHLSSPIVGELSLYFPGPAGSSLREKISPQDNNPPRRLKTITVRSRSLYSVARSRTSFPATTSKKFGQFWKMFGQCHKT